MWQRLFAVGLKHSRHRRKRLGIKRPLRLPVVVVVFQVDAAPGQATGGVKVASVIESQAPEKLVYEPGNPLADAN
ncbi:hypothetical protein MJO10_30240, partial [Salmonella enterica subsp. enterica serovar Anatum]|nr:hypothetical protein [Salmonella enterica subsp. enterica serovar Anatum]